MTRSALALLAAFSLSACHQIEGGPELSETRTLSAFTRVRIEDGLTATFSPGTSQVAISAPEKVVANLVTEVQSGVLVVRLKPNVIVTSLDTTEIVITGDALQAAEATGASKLTVTGVTASPFRATASGGSDLIVSGTTADARLNASGASTLTASDLLAQSVSVEATGASTVSLNASKSVDGVASGASHVVIGGAATDVYISATGASSVTDAPK